MEINEEIIDSNEEKLSRMRLFLKKAIRKSFMFQNWVISCRKERMTKFTAPKT